MANVKASGYQNRIKLKSTATDLSAVIPAVYTSTMKADTALVVVSNYEHAEAMAAFMEAPRKRHKQLAQ